MADFTTRPPTVSHTERLEPAVTSLTAQEFNLSSISDGKVLWAQSLISVRGSWKYFYHIQMVNLHIDLSLIIIFLIMTLEAQKITALVDANKLNQ